MLVVAGFGLHHRLSALQRTLSMICNIGISKLQRTYNHCCTCESAFLEYSSCRSVVFAASARSGSKSCCDLAPSAQRTTVKGGADSPLEIGWWSAPRLLGGLLLMAFGLGFAQRIADGRAPDVGRGARRAQRTAWSGTCVASGSGSPSMPPTTAGCAAGSTPVCSPESGTQRSRGDLRATSTSHGDGQRPPTSLEVGRVARRFSSKE